MTTDSQLSTTKPKKQKQKQTKQTTKTGTEPQKWRSHGSLSARRGSGKKGGKIQGIRRVTGMYKIDRGRLRIV